MSDEADEVPVLGAEGIVLWALSSMDIGVLCSMDIHVLTLRSCRCTGLFKTLFAGLNLGLPLAPTLRASRSRMHSGMWTTVPSTFTVAPVGRKRDFGCLLVFLGAEVADAICFLFGRAIVVTSPSFLDSFAST